MINTSTFSDRALDDWIRTHGEVVQLYAGARCPCGTQPEGADFSCPRCQGLGHFYPTPPQLLVAIVGNVNMNREILSIPGWVLPGDLSMTMRPFKAQNVRVFDFDKVVLTWQNAIPQDGESLTASETGADTLLQVPTAVQSAYGQDITGALLTFTQGIDYTLAGNVVTWVSGNRPPAGTVWTIRYAAQPDWICFVPPRPKLERGTDLGQAVLLRKRSMVVGRQVQT